MNKLLLILSAFVLNLTISFAQPVNYLTAPQWDNSTTGLRVPNGTSAHTYHRGTQLVKATELTGIAPSSTLTSFGFVVSSGASTPVAGTFTVYLQNTTDATYLKGTTWSNIITGMTTVYASTMTIPATGATSVTVNLSTPFVYTGGGIYVAYDWYSAGPYATTGAVYQANSTGLTGGCASAASSSVVPTTVTASSFRPCLLLGTVNTYTNEVSVIGIDADGKIAAGVSANNLVKAVVRNNSNGTLTNIPVSLNITGANPYSNTQSIASLNAGDSFTVSFPSYNSSVAGVNNLTVSVPSDELNTNNSLIYTQNVTCNEWALNPATLTYTSGVGFNTGAGIIAVNYPNQTASSLTGIRVAISSPTTSTGNSVWAVLLSSTGTIIATTNTVAITAGALGTLQTFTFATPQSLSASTNYYIGLAQPSNTTTGYFPIGSSPSVYVPYNNYATTSITGGTPAPLTVNLGYLDIEAVHLAPQILVNSGDICTGNSFTIVPTGANTYSYSSGSNIVSPTSNSSYTVTGSGNGGCVSSAVSTVNVNSLPIVSVNSGTICAGQSFTMVPTGADAYIYSNGSSVATPTANNSYTVTGTNTITGCSNTAVSGVTVSSLPIVSVNSGTICAGQSFTMVPAGADSYAYSNGSNVATPTSNNSYTVTGTNTVTGCSNTAISSVTVNALPVLTAVTNNTLLCAGQTATLSVSGATTYTWSTTANTTTVAVSPTVQITYTVNGTDVNGCSNNTTVTQNVSACTGIATLSNDVSINVYPNPNNGLFVIELPSTSKVTVMNALGQAVVAETFEAGKHTVNINNESTGVYFVKVMTNNKQQIIKVIKE